MEQTATNKSTTYIVPAIIDGREHVLPRTFDVFNPRTSELAHCCSSANITEAEQAIQAAAEAFKIWGKATANERRRVFLNAADIMEQRRSELIGYMSQETGADDAWSNENINIAADLLRDIGGRCGTISGTIPQTKDSSVTGLVLNEPYGAVLSIAPW
jgi:acyl-CoA reductase-like NAD-dependent aldehyde dehydrogenase